MPLSLIFVSMITFNNLCLKYVKVSFYLVARSLTIVFNVLLSYLLLHIYTSVPVLVCCSIVIFGFYIGSEGEMDFSLMGTLFGVCSSLFVSLNSIFTKKMIPRVRNNSWTLCYYVELCKANDHQNNMNSSLLFLPLILIFERKTILEYAASFFSPMFWSIMTLAGVFGFLIGIVTILQIKLTSPLTHNISGTAKACVQTMIAVSVFHERITLRSVIGTCCVLFGTFMYSMVRNREMDKGKKDSPKLAPSRNPERDVESLPLLKRV